MYSMCRKYAENIFRDASNYGTFQDQFQHSSVIWVLIIDLIWKGTKLSTTWRECVGNGSKSTRGGYVIIWGYESNSCFCLQWIENQSSCVNWPALIRAKKDRSLCLQLLCSCYIKECYNWLLSVYKLLCAAFHKIKKEKTHKKNQIPLWKEVELFAFCVTENWATLVSGNKAEKRKESHLPDNLYCAAARHKRHTATLCICPCNSKTEAGKRSL